MHDTIYESAHSAFAPHAEAPKGYAIFDVYGATTDRERVTRDAPKPVVAGPSGFSPSAIGASGFEPSEQSLSSFGSTGGDTGFGNSGFAASKPPSANEPWDAVRKRS